VAEVQPSRVSDQDRELVICALYSGGETLEEIASRFPSSHGGTLSRERIRQIVARNGLVRPGSRSVDPLKVMGLVVECDSPAEIAVRLGAHEEAVAKVLRVLAPEAIVEMAAYRHQTQREWLLQRIRDLAARLGRRPMKADLDLYGPYQSQLVRTFGSMSRGLILAGFPPLRRSHPQMTPARRAEIALRYEPPPLGRKGGNAAALAKEYGITPTYVWMIARGFRGRKAAA
jgi:HNH endonuclease